MGGKIDGQKFLGPFLEGVMVNMHMQYVPPIIVVEQGGDIEIFQTMREVEMYLEPLDVENNEYVIYDSEGRLLTAIVVTEHQCLFGLPFIKIPVKFVRIQCHEPEPRYKESLRCALIEFAERLGMNVNTIKSLPLKDLIEILVRKFAKIE
jgi:hypothetical protein